LGTPENDRAVEVSAVVGGDRAVRNEQELHQSLVDRAAPTGDETGEGST
jgi:hypothetical protein